MNPTTTSLRDMEKINFLNPIEHLSTACPHCGSTKVQVTATDSLVGPPYHPVCQECNNKWEYLPVIQPSENIFIQLLRKLSKKLNG
jgi:hypothetical protein